MRIWMLRHGTTAANAKRLYLGRTDESLSAEGAAAAREIGVSPTVQKVFVSSLRRTQETAKILFPNAEQIVLHELREMDFGVFEGRSADDMEHDEAYRAWVDTGCTGKCPDGESMEEYAGRVCACFAEVIENESRCGAPEAVFVVHGGTLMSVFERFARPHVAYYDTIVKNLQGYTCVTAPSEDGLPFTLRDLRRVVRYGEE